PRPNTLTAPSPAAAGRWWRSAPAPRHPRWRARPTRRAPGSPHRSPTSADHHLRTSRTPTTSNHHTARPSTPDHAHRSHPGGGYWVVEVRTQLGGGWWVGGGLRRHERQEVCGGNGRWAAGSG